MAPPASLPIESLNWLLDMAGDSNSSRQHEIPPRDERDGLFIDDQVSSPSNGAHTIEEEGFFSTDSGSPLYGDIHFYMYDKVNRDCFLIP